MRRFERAPDGGFVALADAAEAQILSSLARQVAELVEGSSDEDPALRRLLPDAYGDDAVASAEFRRFTQAGLSQRKVANARLVVESLADVEQTGEVRVDERTAGAWLRSLTDIRLVLAVRLGIETEDEEDGVDVDPMMRDIYDWLGFIQNSLVEALDGS